nr:hypothetical protein [uncultured Desulfobacter sp.]
MALVCKENKGDAVKFGDRGGGQKKKAPGDHSDAIRESMVHNTTLWHEVNLNNLVVF